MENVCIEWSDLSKINNIDNNKKNLSSVFEESVKSCIFDKYDKIKLDTKDNALYEIKISMFENMLMLYYYYVCYINNKDKKHQWFIKGGNSNSNSSNIIQLSKDSAVDLRIIKQTLETKFKCVPNFSQFRREMEQKKLENISQIEDDEEAPVETNLVIPNKLLGLVNSSKNKVNKMFSSAKTMLTCKNKGRSTDITDISVFCYFLNKINNYLISKNLEGIKLDFILEVAHRFLSKDKKLFFELQEWLSNKGKMLCGGSFVKYKDVKDIIDKIHEAGMTDFKIPYNIILNYILKSDAVERYTFEDLNNMLNEFAGPYAKNSKSANDNTIRMNKILLLQAFADNPNKTITFYCMPDDFTNLLKILIEVSGNSVCLTNKKKITANDLARGLQALQNSRNIYVPKIDFYDMLLKILNKIRTQCSKDESYEVNFYTQNWIYEVYDVGPIILEFMAQPCVPFDCLSILLKKFRLVTENNDFDIQWINQIIDRLYTEFDRLEQDKSTINQVNEFHLYLNDNAKQSLKTEKLSKFAKAFEFFYGNFLYPIVSNKFYNKSNISVDAYNKLIKMTNSLMECGLLDGSHERKFINGSKQLTNAQDTNSNKIAEIKSDSTFDIKKTNKFDIYAINSMLINTQQKPLTFADKSCLTLEEVFSWYKYLKLNGNKDINKEWLYYYFCKTKNKIIRDTKDLMAVDFIIDIWNGRNNHQKLQMKIEKNVTLEDFKSIQALTSSYVNHLTNLLNEADCYDSQSLQNNMEKFFNLVHTAMSLYFDNLIDGDKNKIGLCKNFIDTLDPLLEYVSQNNNYLSQQNLLYCKFYLTKAINEVEHALLKKVLGKTNENVENNLSLYDLYKQMIVFEEKRRLCAFNANDYLINSNSTFELQLKIKCDFSAVVNSYLSKLPKKSQDKTKLPDNSKCIQNKSITDLVDQLYTEHYNLIRHYHLSDGVHLVSAIESSLMVVDKFYRALPFTNPNLIYDLDVFLDSVTDKLFSVAEKQLKGIKSKEFRKILTNYLSRLANRTTFELEEWPQMLSRRALLQNSLPNDNVRDKNIENANKIINQDNELGNVAIPLRDFNTALYDMLKSQKLNSKVNSIAELSNRIADYAVFREQDSNEIRHLFERINEICQPGQIHLDDVFPIIQALFFDATISPDLINIFTDQNLFKPSSLSLENLDKLAKIIRLKGDARINTVNKYNNPILGNLDENDIVNVQPIENLWKMINFDCFYRGEHGYIATTIFTYLDLVSVVYGKKINYNDNVQGTFTASEINTIIKKGFELFENWYELCKFIKYNWNGYGIVTLPDNGEFTESNDNVAILEFFKALQCPAVKSIELNDNYAGRLKSSIQSITKNVELLSKDKKNKNKNKIDILEIIKAYVDELTDPIKKLRLNYSQRREIYNELETLLEKIYQCDRIQNDYSASSCQKEKLLDGRNKLLGFLVDIKSSNGNINNWYPILRFVGRGQLINQNPLDIFYLFYQSEEINSNLDPNIVKNWIYEYLNILADNCLQTSDFDNLYTVMHKHEIKLNKKQFIDFLRLSKCQLTLDCFSLCLQNLLQQDTECFDDEELKKIFSKIEGLDQDRIGYITKASKALCSIRKYIQTDFSFSSEDGNPISFSIAKSIANASANKDNIARIKYVFKQFNDKKIKIKTKDLEEIFKYYGLNDQKLDICGENGRSHLDLLIGCVQVLSSDQFKLPDIIQNEKSGTDKNKGKNNIASYGNSSAMEFLKRQFTHSGYGTLQMGHNAVIELIGVVLSGQNWSGKEVEKQKQQLVINLLCLFWTPVYDYKMLDINMLKGKISPTTNNNKGESWLNDNSFAKNVAIMYFVKHLYSLLLEISQEKIGPEKYLNISDAIQELQRQLARYNNETKDKNRKISKDDISKLYTSMIDGNNGHLPNVELKLFKDIKEGILDLITSADEDQAPKRNQNIMISFAILHAMNSVKENANSKNNNNYDYSSIFTEVINSGALEQYNKCDLETLKFVFDQMLGRGDGQGDQNKLSVPFNDNGQKLFDTALGCLNDDSVNHGEIFDFLRDYFMPNIQNVRLPEKNLIQRIFSRIKNLFKKIKENNTTSNNNHDYLMPEHFNPKTKEVQNQNNNHSQDNNVSKPEFKLSKDNIKNIMEKSKNHFLFYSSDSQANNAASQATGEFLAPYKDALSSEMIVKYISKFKFQDLPSFEDFMKEYWMYDLSKICAADNFESSVEQDSMKFCVTKLMLMNKINKGKYHNEDDKRLLAYLAKTLKEIKNQNKVNENVSVEAMQRYCLEFCDLNKNNTNDEDQEEIDKINREIALLFGSKKRYKNWGYGLLIALLATIILSIVLSSDFNAYLLIATLILIFISIFCIKNLWDRKKFNDERQELETLGEDFSQPEYDRYMDESFRNNYPDEEEINAKRPSMEQSNQNIINPDYNQ